ncbi:MAG TPA: RloB family protein [Candidatus Cloacimonadota bacterium]|nr:RloB family protein [Candidatus Cloacimonadota bacterium]
MGKRSNTPAKQFKRVINIFCPGDVERAYLEKLKADRYPNGPRVDIKPKLGQADKYADVMDDIADLLSDSTGTELVFYVNDMDAIVAQGKLAAYESKKNRLKRKAGDRVVFIESMPCIEFWFLLHLCYLDRYWASWEELKPELLRKIAGYEKTRPRVTRLYDEIREQLAEAIERAKRSTAKHEEGLEACSYTYMHQLIEKLDEVFCR